jgi:hypothetical protein
MEEAPGEIGTERDASVVYHHLAYKQADSTINSGQQNKLASNREWLTLSAVLDTEHFDKDRLIGMASVATPPSLEVIIASWAVAEHVLCESEKEKRQVELK